jgi:hypothetical protein
MRKKVKVTPDLDSPGLGDCIAQPYFDERSTAWLAEFGKVGATT